MRIDLTEKQYLALSDAFAEVTGCQLHMGEHESTLEVGPYLLCRADGVYWLDLVFPLPDVSGPTWDRLVSASHHEVRELKPYVGKELGNWDAQKAIDELKVCASFFYAMALWKSLSQR